MACISPLSHSHCCGHFSAELEKLTRHSRDLTEDVSRLDQQLRDTTIEKEATSRELERVTQQVRCADSRINQLEREKRQLSESLNETQKSAMTAEKESQESVDLIQRLQEDKKRLSQRIEKLTANERALILEIERSRSGSKRVKPSQVEEYMRGVEQDRDYWKNEAALAAQLAQKLNADVDFPASKSRNGSRSGSRSASPVKNKNGNPEKSENEIALMDENDRLRKENLRLKSQMRTSSPVREVKNTYQNLTKSTDLSENSRLRRENADMRNLLNKLEHRVADIQGNVRVLTQERDNLARLYEDTRLEAQRLREDIGLAHCATEKSVSEHHMMSKRAEAERDDALNELNRVCLERDSILERYKSTVDAATLDKHRLEQRLDENLANLESVTDERNKLLSRVSSLTQQVRNLEDKLNKKEEEFKTTKAELEEQNSAATNFKQDLEEARVKLADTEHLLDETAARLREVDARAASLHDHNIHLEREICIQRDDYAKLRSRMSQVDQEREGLQAIAEERAERISQLEAHLAGHERTLSEMRMNLSTVEQQYSRCQEALLIRDREIRTLQNQLDAMNSELNAERNRAENMLRETERLEEDLANLTKENQALQTELQHTAEEREEWRARSLAAEQQNLRTNDLLAESEKGRAELAEERKSLAQKIESERAKSAGEIATLKTQIGDRDAEVRGLKTSLERAERDCREQRAALSANETQIASLNHTIHDLEEEIHAGRHEKQEILSDLAAMRDLCTRLETSKETLQRDLSNTSLDLDTLRAQMDDMEQENDDLQNQLDTEKESVKNLEAILAVSRDREYQSQLDIQDRDNEIALLKQQQSQLEDQLSDSQNTVDSLSDSNAELRTDIDRLQRCLSEERCEKDRVIADLRLCTLSPAYRPPVCLH